MTTESVFVSVNPHAPLRETGIRWLGKIPAHWKSASLKMVSHSLQTGPFGTQLHAKDYVDNGIPVINPTHLVNGHIVHDPTVTITQFKAQSLAVHKLIEGDVVLARRRDIRRCAFVEQMQVGWLCGTGCLRVRVDKAQLLPMYLVHLLLSSPIGVQLEVMSVGTTMKNINTEIVGDLQIPLPSIQEQQEIIDYIATKSEKIDSLMMACQQTIQLLTEQRGSLISAAVTGQLDITE